MKTNHIIAENIRTGPVTTLYEQHEESHADKSQGRKKIGFITIRKHGRKSVLMSVILKVSTMQKKLEVFAWITN